MSAGGMDWACRTIQAHKLDPLGVAIVQHLGWRDHPDFRTDRGIARALNQHRSSVCKATAKLAALGIIERRSEQWVSCETVAIVEGKAGARRPSAAASDVAGPLSGPAHSVGHAGPLSGPLKDHSVGHKEKEKIEKGGAACGKRPVYRSAPPLPLGGQVGGLLWSDADFEAFRAIAPAGESRASWVARLGVDVARIALEQRKGAAG